MGQGGGGGGHQSSHRTPLRLSCALRWAGLKVGCYHFLSCLSYSKEPTSYNKCLRGWMWQCPLYLKLLGKLKQKDHMSPAFRTSLGIIKRPYLKKFSYSTSMWLEIRALNWESEYMKKFKLNVYAVWTQWQHVTSLWCFSFIPLERDDLSLSPVWSCQETHAALRHRGHRSFSLHGGRLVNKEKRNL